MTRTQKLIQETAAGNSWRQRETELLRNQALRLYAAEPVHNIKHAQVECYLMEHITAEIGPNELLVGRLPVDCPFSPDEEKAFQDEAAYAKAVGRINGIDSGATYHRVLDYEKVLKIGISGILQEIAKRRAAIDVTQPDTIERAVVYQAAEIALKGAVILAERYRQMLAELADTTSDADRAGELRTLAGILARVPDQPPRSFYEALQSMWLIQFCAFLIGDFSLTGRPDQYLYPYYRHDLETGVLTPEFALELIEQLYCKNNQIYGTWPASLMVGGVDRDGRPNWNELSYLFVRAIETTKLINPSVAVCYNEDIPEDLLQLGVKIIAQGLTKPAFFNDRLIIEGLVRAGVILEDARQYIHSTCVEITPIAASNISVATPYINLCKAFEYLFHDGRKIYGDEEAIDQVTATDLSELKTFASFYRRYKEIAAGIIRTQLQHASRDVYLKA
ncbi:MAG TPA: hypothetical protein DD640_10475, partial [Clostridiales bacterium]|nr:hypothetical protein [Clostridiales bacterium]